MIEDKIYANNFTLDELPAGGYASSTGFAIIWQDGPLREAERNGAFVETVLAACRHRIRFYQDSRFTCPENAEAIAHIDAALNALNERTRMRIERGTEGTHQI